MRIQTVFLDAGGVLVNPNWDRVSDALARHGVQAGAAALAAAEPHAKRLLDTNHGIRTTTDADRGWTFFNLILDAAGIPLSAATDAALEDLHAYHREYNLWETVLDGVPPVLAALRARGLRLAVVSNANGRLQRLFERIGLADAVDALFDSCEEGIEKPDPRYFQIALARTGASAETTVHVGDLYHVDVVGARAAGIAPVLLDVADLYADADCDRIRTLDELMHLVARESRAAARPA